MVYNGCCAGQWSVVWCVVKSGEKLMVVCHL